MMEVDNTFLVLLALLLSTAAHGLTQTEAYLKINKPLVESCWKQELKDYKNLIESCLQREQQHLNTHYVFYHSQKGMFTLFRDLLKEIYQKSQKVTLYPYFEFTRLWHEALTTVDANTFIDAEENGYHFQSWNDHETHLRNSMLSTNLSLFGNTNNMGECTFSYFLNNTNIAPPDISFLLDQIFNKFKFNQEYKQKLIDLLTGSLRSDTSLLQIFIPSHLVDRCTYLSSSYGTPYRNALTASFSTTKNRHLDISSVLKLYQTNPDKLKDHLDHMQARIIISQDILLNPNSGVLVYTYSKSPEEHLAAYRKQLKKLIIIIYQVKSK